MKIAVDLEGTLTRDTEQLHILMKELLSYGHDVYIISSCIKKTPLKGERDIQIKNLGFKKGIDFTFHAYISVQTLKLLYPTKATFCKDNNIDLLFTSEDEFIKEVNKKSPHTSTWLIRRFQK